MTVDPLLREAAELKIEGFNQLKQDFKTLYGLGSPQATNVTLRERIVTLVKTIQQLDPYLEEDGDLTVIASYVQQTGEDYCVSNDKLLKFEEQLLDKLHRKMNRYEATSLHLNLMKEAMNARKSATSLFTKPSTVTIDDDFEVVENGLEELWERFEAETFSVKEVDINALEAYLTGLTQISGNVDALSELRESMCQFGNDIIEGNTEIEEEELEWCIMDLLQNDLVSAEKKKKLESYIQNTIAVKELLSAVNMKSIRHWNWKNIDSGLPVVARQDNEGQCHITIEEDFVDMLFLHCVAFGWAQKLKECLSDFVRYPFRHNKRSLSAHDHMQREFFLQMMPSEPIEVPGIDCQIGSYPLVPPPPRLPPPPPPSHAPLPPPPPVLASGHANSVYVIQPFQKVTRKKKKGALCSYPLPAMTISPPPPPPLFLDSLNEERHRVYKREFFMSKLPTRDGCRPRVVPVEEVQANLIKTLVVEMKLRAAFDGRYSCSMINFRSLSSALPHQTVLVVLKFLGMPDLFVDFFARFLAANLNIGPSVQGVLDRFLTRKCGVPERHGLHVLFTEAVMFFAELAVMKRTGMHLYRLGSKCYFVGTREQCEQVTQELNVFSEQTKIQFEDVLTHSGRFDIGFLQLTAEKTTIKRSMVVAYAHSMKKRLSACTTVYDWVRVWNSSVGTYASHLFGPLVELFGRSHLEAVKSAYKRIFHIIFEGGTLSDHVKEMLCARSEFARASPPLALEAIIHLPQAFGGLGVKNPFIAFSVARNMTPDPDAVIREYLDVETKYYEAAAKNWSVLEPEHISKKLSGVFQNNDEVITAALGADCAPATFITKAALTRHREYATYPYLPFNLLRDMPVNPLIMNLSIPHLVGLYRALITVSIEDVIASEHIKNQVRDHGSLKRWEQLSSEDKWVLQIYGDDCLERYGTLDIWIEEHVPIYCMTVVKGKDWYSDDDSSSYMSSAV